MTHTLTVTLSEPVYTALKQAAAAAAKEPAALAADALTACYPPAVPRNRRPGAIRGSFGAVSVGHPDGLDNEKIDAALADSYGDAHETP